jgi:hypothetical protein
MNRSLIRAVAEVVSLCAWAGAANAAPPGTAFTYQGTLTQGGQAVSGPVPMRFSLYNAATGGTLVSGVIAIIVQADQGLFTAQPDFGAGVLPYIEQEELWVQVEVDGTALSPRQLLTAAPRALHATTAVSARGAVGEFNITGPSGILSFDTMSIGLDPAVGGIIVVGGDVFLGGPDTSQPKAVHFGTAAGAPIIGSASPLSGVKVGPGNIYMFSDVNDKPALFFGNTTGSPYLIPTNYTSLPPRPQSGLLMGGTEVWLGGSNMLVPTLRLGGASDPSIRFDRSAGAIIIDNGVVAIGDPEISQGKTLRFGSATSGPGIGVDPSVGGIIVVDGREITIGGPGETGAKVLHFGNDVTNPTPFISTSANNLRQLTLNASSAIRLDGSFVGVGLVSTAAPQFRLDLPNTAGAGGQGRANAWTTYSSRRWKENVQPLQGALATIARLEAVTFDWKAEQGGVSDLGFIAEDVGKVLPELVEWEEGGEFARSLKYDRMSAVAIQGIKEQQAQIENLRAQNADLKARLERLEALVVMPTGGATVPR